MNLLKNIKAGIDSMLGKTPTTEKPPTKKPPGTKDLEKAIANTGRLLKSVRKALGNKILNVTELNLIAEDENGLWFVATAVPQPPIVTLEEGKTVKTPQPPLIGLTFLPLASAKPVLTFSDRDTTTIPKLEKALGDKFKNFRFVTQREMNAKAEEYLVIIQRESQEVLANIKRAEALKTPEAK